MKFDRALIVSSIVFALVAMWLAAPCLAQEQLSEVERLYAEVFPDGPIRYDRLKQVSSAEREKLLESLRDRVKHAKRTDDGKFLLFDDVAVWHSALLGDEEAKDLMVQTYLSHPRNPGLAIRFLQDPRIIATIGELLFAEEQYVMSDDVGIPPTKDAAADIVISIVKNASVFSDEVKSWADRVRYRHTVMLLREWYRSNEEKLKSGDFENVLAGREPRSVIAAPAVVSMPTSVVENQSQRTSKAGITWVLGGLLGAVVLFGCLNMGRRRPGKE